MRNITVIKTAPGKSATAWTKLCPVWKAAKNWVFFRLALISPGNVNQIFYRLMGVKIGKNVQIMPRQAIDIFFPEMITIEDGAVLGIECFLSCHEFNPTEFRYGPITVKKNSLLGARSFVLPGVVIGEGAMVSAQTVVYKDIPAGVLAFGGELQFKELGESKKKK